MIVGARRRRNLRGRGIPVCVGNPLSTLEGGHNFNKVSGGNILRPHVCSQRITKRISVGEPEGAPSIFLIKAGVECMRDSRFILQREREAESRERGSLNYRQRGTKGRVGGRETHRGGGGQRGREAGGQRGREAGEAEKQREGERKGGRLTRQKLCRIPAARVICACISGA